MFFKEPEIIFEAIDFDNVIVTTSPGGGGQVDYCTTGSDVIQTEGDDEDCAPGMELL